MRTKISTKNLAALKPGKQISDSVVVGFSARRQASGAVSFCLRYRVKGAAKAQVAVIGRWQSPWTPEDARTEATRLLLEAAQGRDPAAPKEAVGAMTVGDLVAEYTVAMTSGRLLTKSGKPKAKSTIASDTGRLRLHVLPVLGKLPLADLTKQACEKLMHQIADGATTRRAAGKKMANAARGGKGAASRTMTLLSAVLNFGVDRGYVTTNPAKGVRRFAGVKKDRHLSDAEYAQLGQALRNPPPGTLPAMLAAVRFTALSGWRCGEVVGLRWDAIDLQRRVAVLAETKTGASVRPLSQAAVAILAAQERAPGQVLVFNPTRRTQPAGYAYRAAFGKVLKAAGLAGSKVSPHTLRHSFVSTGGDLEVSESSIANLVGHVTRSMTGRYTHRSDASLLAAADTIGRRLLALLGDDPAPVAVVPLPRPSASRPRLDPAKLAVEAVAA